MANVKWRVKNGVAPHYHGRKQYLSGEEFMGPPWLGKSFPDKLEPATDAAAAAVKKVEDGGEVAALKVVHRGSGKYDVVNTESGKKINEQLLKREEAEELVAGTPSTIIKQD